MFGFGAYFDGGSDQVAEIPAVLHGDLNLLSGLPPGLNPGHLPIDLKLINGKIHLIVDCNIHFLIFLIIDIQNKS